MRNSGHVGVEDDDYGERVGLQFLTLETNEVEARIYRLRDKIEEKVCATKLIHTIRGVGYVLLRRFVSFVKSLSRFD